MSEMQLFIKNTKETFEEILAPLWKDHSVVNYPNKYKAINDQNSTNFNYEKIKYLPVNLMNVHTRNEKKTQYERTYPYVPIT